MESICEGLRSDIRPQNCHFQPASGIHTPPRLQHRAEHEEHVEWYPGPGEL